MRFSLFELLAWITFLAICCALILTGPLGNGMPRAATMLWIVTVVFVTRCCPIVIGACIGFLDSVIQYTSSINSMPLTDFILFGVILYSIYGVFVWLAVAAADYLIRLAKNRVNRVDRRPGICVQKPPD